MMSPSTRPKGRPKGSGQFEGQRFTVRLPAELTQRLVDRARGRADQATVRTDRTRADAQPTGQVSHIIREAVEHYLSGCDREAQEAKPKRTKRTQKRTPARAAKG